MKGTATPTTPAPPTTAVAAVKKRRRPLFTGTLLIHTLQFTLITKQLLLTLLFMVCVIKMKKALFFFDQTYTKRYIDKKFVRS
jgi:hypothetical protein